MAKVRIEGHVLDNEGNPVVGAIVTLPGVGKRTSRKDGRFVFDRAELKQGRHSIRCDPPEGYQRPGDLSIDVEKGHDMITGLNFICAAPAQTLGGTENMSNQIPLEECCGELRDTLKDIATFMPTRGELTGVAGGGGVEGVAAQRRVSKVIAQVLGRPLGRDPRTFLAALTAAFPERGGQIVQQPVRAVLNLEVEREQLAVRQGSLFHEIQLIVNDALKILDGLRSINPATDSEKVDALREIVRSEFLSLLEEAGRVDLPRASRVIEVMGQLFNQGWGAELKIDLYPTEESHLGRLRDELGLKKSERTVTIGNDEIKEKVLDEAEIVTSDEVQQVVSMDLLDHYAYGVGGSFASFFFEISGQPRESFSGRAEIVSLLLSVVAACVHDVEDAMDAVGLSEAKRRTVFIEDWKLLVKVDEELVPREHRISVDGILSWTLAFSSEEGPDLIARGGRFGFLRVLATAERLKKLVEKLQKSSAHPGLSHPRVHNALVQLADQLDQFDSGDERHGAAAQRQGS